MDCFIPNFKLKYEDSEDIKADRVDTVFFYLREIKRGAFFGTPSIFELLSAHDMLPEGGEGMFTNHKRSEKFQEAWS